MTKFIIIIIAAVVGVGSYLGLRAKSQSTIATPTLAISPVATSTPKKISINVRLTNHLAEEFPEQDVFIEKGTPRTRVYRTEGDLDSAALAKKVFATTEAIPHDLFKLGKNPLGPFTKGKALGLTLEQWLAAKGSGSYEVIDDKAKLSLNFQKLIPSATYSVWCSRLNLPPENQVSEQPCGKSDGSENSFKTNLTGHASFSLDFAPLADSTEKVTSLITVVYHSDNKTHGTLPGDWGVNAHTQLLFSLPALNVNLISATPLLTTSPALTATVSPTP